MPRRSTLIALAIVLLAAPAASSLELSPRSISVGKELTTGAAQKIADQLFKLDASGDQPILLHISTRSGYAPAAMMVVDAIGAVKSDVYAVVRSEAFGVGAIIAAFCKKRYAFAHASILFTKLQYDSDKVMKDAPPLPVEAADAYVDRVWTEVAKQLSLKKGALIERAEKGWFLTADQARREGILTEVIKDVKWQDLVVETVEIKRTRTTKKKGHTTTLGSD